MRHADELEYVFVEADEEPVARLPGLVVAAGVLGWFSWAGAIFGILCLLAGPFTCFASWFILLSLAPYLGALHCLTIAMGFVILATRQPGEPVPSTATLALTASSIGLAPYLVFLLCWIGAWA